MNLLKKLYKKMQLYIRIFINRLSMLRSPAFKSFLQSADDQRFILLDTPTHGNLGDHAIVIAEKQFIEAFFPTKRVYEFTQQDYLSCEKEIIASLNQSDIILIPGGGFIGTLWPNHEKVILRILKKLRAHKIIIFPHTFFFEQSKQGEAALRKFKKAVNSCNNLFLFARERQSYDFLTQEVGIPIEQCSCVPDIVTFLSYEQSYERTDKVLLCLRNDIEKVTETNNLEEIKKELTKRNLEFEYTDTVIQHKRIFGNESEKLVHQKLSEFAQCKLVITDRLHGMLMAAITGTPCLFMDNSSRKVSGTYEWIKELEYIKPLDMQTMNAFINHLKDGQTYHYHNEHLQIFYEKMAEIIKR